MPPPTKCKFCRTNLHGEVFEGHVFYIDDTGGDCCWGDDELVNENEYHVPDWENK